MEELIGLLKFKINAFGELNLSKSETDQFLVWLHSLEQQREAQDKIIRSLQGLIQLGGIKWQ